MTLGEQEKLNAPATRPVSTKIPASSEGASPSNWFGFPFFSPGGFLTVGQGEPRDPSNPFEFWISLFPTAPLFGVKWSLAEGPASFLSAGAPFGLPVAGAAAVNRPR